MFALAPILLHSLLAPGPTAVPPDLCARPCFQVTSEHRELTLRRNGVLIDPGWAWHRLPHFLAASPPAALEAERASRSFQAAWILGLSGGMVFTAGAVMSNERATRVVGLSAAGAGVAALITTLFLASIGEDQVRAAVARYGR